MLAHIVKKNIMEHLPIICLATLTTQMLHVITLHSK